MKKNLDDYILEGKNDIIVYSCMFILLSLLLLIIGCYLNFVYIIFLSFFLLLPRIIERIVVYNNLKIINSYLLNNNLVNKIGNIDYWNDYYYFLTENYMIIIYKKKVYLVDYNNIDYIYSRDKISLGKNSYVQTFLYIHTKQKKTFRIMIYSSILVGEELKDISSYLIEKNSDIEIKEFKENSIKDFFQNDCIVIDNNKKI